MTYHEPFVTELTIAAKLSIACSAHPDGQKGWAADHDLSPAFVCDVLKGRRAPTDAIAAPLGYRRKVVFERVGR